MLSTCCGHEKAGSKTSLPTYRLGWRGFEDATRFGVIPALPRCQPWRTVPILCMIGRRISSKSSRKYDASVASFSPYEQARILPLAVSFCVTAHQSRKLDRKPCIVASSAHGVQCICYCAVTDTITWTHGRSKDETRWTWQRLSLPAAHALRRHLTVRNASRLDFMRAAGIVHTLASASISLHSAPRVSHCRVAVNTRKRSANFAAAPAVPFSTCCSVSATAPCGTAAKCCALGTCFR